MVGGWGVTSAGPVAAGAGSAPWRRDLCLPSVAVQEGGERGAWEAGQGAPGAGSAPWRRDLCLPSAAVQ